MNTESSHRQFFHWQRYRAAEHRAKMRSGVGELSWDEVSLSDPVKFEQRLVDGT